MRIESRGVAWDRAGLARVLSIGGKVSGVLSLVMMALLSGDAVMAIPAGVMMASFVVVLVGFVIGLGTPRELPGEVDVDEAGTLRLRVGKKERTFARDRVRGAWMVRRLVTMREYFWVEIATKSGTMLSVRVADPDQGRALVEALGFGAVGRAVTMPLAKPTRRLLHLILAFAAYVISTFAQIILGFGGIFLAFPIFYELFRFLFRAPVLTIGNDALHVRTGVRSFRLRREDIARIVFFAPSSLIVERKNGTKLRVLPLALEPSRVAAAAQLIDARLGDRPAPARAAAFERGGRGLAEWRAGLRAAFDPSYRTSGVSIDDAAAILASTSASTEQRVGAALALRSAGEPLDRVRVAAEGAVDPKVRVVLDAIADGADEERLDETLRRMER